MDPYATHNKPPTKLHGAKSANAHTNARTGPEGVVVVVNVAGVALVVLRHRLAHRRGHGRHLCLPLEDGLEGAAVGWCGWIAGCRL